MIKVIQHFLIAKRTERESQGAVQCHFVRLLIGAGRDKAAEVTSQRRKDRVEQVFSTKLTLNNPPDLHQFGLILRGNLIEHVS